MDLLATEGITFDNLFWVDRLPQTHFEAVIRRYGKYFGGRAPNVAVAAAKLGIKTGVVSPVGDDFESEGYESYLKEIGVDLRGVVKITGEKTKQIFIFTDPQGNQITFFNYGAEHYFEKMEIPTDLIKKSKIVHISSSGDYKFNVRCAKFAHENGVSVSFDPGNDPFTEIPEYLESMLQYSEFLFMNDIEAHGIIERLGLETEDELLSLGPRIVVIINKDDKSSLIYAKGSLEEIPSTIRTVKDPTGASDGYIATFLTAYIKGYDPRTAGMLAAVEASFVVESFGSQSNFPLWDLLCKRYYAIYKEKPKHQ